MDVCQRGGEIEYELISQESEQDRVRRDLRLHGAVQALFRGRAHVLR